MEYLVISTGFGGGLLNATEISDGKYVFSGYEGLFLQTLIDYLGLKVKIFNFYEYGLIHSRELVDDYNVADIAIGLILMNYDRFMKAYMSFPYNIVHITFVVRKSVPISTKFAFLYPFTLNTWLGFLLAFLLLPVVGVLMQDLKITYVNMGLQMLSSLLKQGLQFPMMSFKSRMFFTAFFFFSLVVSFSYSAVFFSFMVNPLKNPPVKNFKELSEAVRKNTHKCFGSDVYAVHYALNQSSYDYVRALYRNIDRDNTWVRNSKANYEKELFEGNAFLRDDIFLDLQFGSNPDLFVSDDRISPSMIGIYMKKDFCLKNKINTFISRAWQSGIYQKNIKRYSS